MMLASLSMITLSSCKKDDPTPLAKDITISVTGGTSVTVEGTDIVKDITVTAVEKTTKDVVVTLTSNAVAGEATITPAQITIPKGELSATSKITFALAKFLEGTAEKKITVTIASPTEGVELGAATTDFIVRGVKGEEMATLTIVANGTEFNTTESAKDLSVVFTLSKALTEKLPVTITLDPSSSQVFKDMFPGTIPAIEIPANETTFTIPFSMPMGTEGLLKINFAISNEKVDLKTTTLSATFIVDAPVLPTLTITGNNTAFNTTSTNQTLIVTYALSGALTEDLDITINYEGSSDEIKELFADRTSMRIGAEIETATMNFEVTQGMSGKLVLNFGINNEDATLLTPKLEATFTNDNAPATFSLERVTTGDVVVPKTGNREDLFKVTLNKASAGAVVTLTSSDPTNGAVTPTSVTFAAAETSKDVTITFLSSYFADETVVKDITITGISTLAAETAAITYHVKGKSSDTPITPLCRLGLNSWDGLYTKQFTVGTYTSTAHTENVPYTDLTGSVTANLTNGDNIVIKAVNLQSSVDDIYRANAWVDWNNDGSLSAGELVMDEAFEAGAKGGTETTTTKVFTAPNGTNAGKYSMRIGATYEKDGTNDGCSNEHETFDFTDIIINYTAQ